MRQTAYKIMIAATVTVMAVMAAGALTQASAQGNIGGRVTNPDPKNPRSNSIFIYSMKHGQTKTDQLTVVNSTNTKQTIKIGSVDGVVTNTGAFTCRQELEPVRDSGGWVNLSTRKVTLEAGARKNIDFTVTVPQKADVGEHNSCITLQSDSDTEKSDNPGLNVHMRQAIRMVVTIPGDLKRELSISSFGVSTNENGNPQYDMTVSNKGNVSADVDMDIVLKNIFGQEVDSGGGESPVLPDVSLSRSFSSDFRPLFGGIYIAEPSISYDKRLAIHGTKDSGKDQLETKTSDSVRLLMLPTVAGWLIIVGVIAAVVAAIWLSIDRKQRHLSIQASLKSYTVKPGDTIQKLADKFGSDWRDIARINKIRAPYTLHPGDEIKIPVQKNEE